MSGYDKREDLHEQVTFKQSSLHCSEIGRECGDRLSMLEKKICSQKIKCEGSEVEMSSVS